MQRPSVKIAVVIVLIYRPFRHFLLILRVSCVACGTEGTPEIYIFRRGMEWHPALPGIRPSTRLLSRKRVCNSARLGKPPHGLPLPIPARVLIEALLKPAQEEDSSWASPGSPYYSSGTVFPSGSVCQEADENDRRSVSVHLPWGEEGWDLSRGAVRLGSNSLLDAHLPREDFFLGPLWPITARIPVTPSDIAGANPVCP